jgi:hypothetical protein
LIHYLCAIPSGASGARRTIAWFPEGGNANEINVSITITNVSVEFTKLGSFGNVFAFGSNLVNQMDRSYLLRSKKNTQPVQVGPSKQGFNGRRISRGLG